MLIELLRDAVETAGDRRAVVSPGRSTSYDELLARSHAVARGLSARRISRFGCATQDVADVIACLAGASATGSEACVYPRDLDDEDLARFAARFDHPVVITDAPSALTGTAVALPMDELDTPSGPTPPVPADAVVLILTTGTTGDQKGARHDWARLVAAVRGHDTEPGARWLLTYNPNQFGGLQVLLHALSSQGTIVVPGSRRPHDVIAAMREHAVTHVSATPSFWRLLAGRLGPDTAAELTVEQITLGGEAVPETLLERLRELFPQARISQVYAATEVGSAVSVRDGRSGLPLSVLDRDDDADVQMRIVDGELQMRSKVGMLGYHDEDGSEHEWRSTGDLVEVDDDRIHFVGRATEIINVGGAKVHPLPIEDLVAAVEGVEQVAAYGRPNPITGQIVALDVVAGPGVDPPTLEQQIRARCEALPPAGRPRRVRFVPELEIREHKLVRRAPAEDR